MRRAIPAIILAASMILSLDVSADEAAAEKLELKNGGVLFIHPDGTSRMIDAHGKKIFMSSDVEMELQDGRIIMMKNKTIWMRYGSPGSGHEGLITD